MEFLKGKKTFITLALFAVLAVVSLIAKIEVPEWIFVVLAGLGLGFLRSAVKHLSGNSGCKTYVAVVATVGLGTLQAFGVTIPPDVLTAVYGMLGAFGVVGVRDALAEIPKK